MLAEAFWTIVTYAFVFGVAALVGWVFYFWFSVIPKRVLAAKTRAQAHRRT